MFKHTATKTFEVYFEDVTRKSPVHDGIMDPIRQYLDTILHAKDSSLNTCLGSMRCWYLPSCKEQRYRGERRIFVLFCGGTSVFNFYLYFFIKKNVNSNLLIFGKVFRAKKLLKLYIYFIVRALLWKYNFNWREIQ